MTTGSLKQEKTANHNASATSTDLMQRRIELGLGCTAPSQPIGEIAGML